MLTRVVVLGVDESGLGVQSLLPHLDALHLPFDVGQDLSLLSLLFLHALDQVTVDQLRPSTIQHTGIRVFPDHATFREKGAKLACADKLGVFLSLTRCNKANFDPLQRVKYDGLEKMGNRKKMYGLSSFS